MQSTRADNELRTKGSLFIRATVTPEHSRNFTRKVRGEKEHSARRNGRNKLTHYSGLHSEGKGNNCSGYGVRSELRKTLSQTRHALHHTTSLRQRNKRTRESQSYTCSFVRLFISHFRFFFASLFIAKTAAYQNEG